MSNAGVDSEKLQRKLAAVIHADAAGFSRLMSQDEPATVAALEACRAVFRERVLVHSGRVVDTAGDSVLAVFESVVDAVACAVSVQQVLQTQHDAVPEERRLMFRIGVNLGDVITRPDGTVYGDGVNIAARIEGLAEAGGVAVAGSVYDSVAGKLDLAFVDLGEQDVKNIARPVRVYRVAATAPQVAVAGAATATKDAPAAHDRPDKPSVAVLPFNNMSGDTEQEFFADGITEDIITELSRFRDLFVVARNSSFQYRDKAVDVRRVARDLGVRYVVEGSVRKMAGRVRITAQLIDASTGNHVWGERYDRSIDDLFEVQDEVTRTIVATLVGRVEHAEIRGTQQKRTDNLHAY
ncbi:MAG: adenylate/guanylate cyclase domain-containing protein, partial [Terriglobales bacterium]